jgi:hypothetical protein
MKSQLTRGYFPLLFIVISIFSIKQVSAQAIQLSWIPNPESDIMYYSVYKDTLSNPQTEISKVAASNTTYFDYDIILGKEYYYRITAVDSADNVSEFSDEVRIIAGNPTNIIGPKGDIPEKFKLSQNYPNPFSVRAGSASSGTSETTMNYGMSKDGHVKLIIVDILGREVITLVNEYKRTGYHMVKWNGKDNYGNDVCAGIYFCQMKVEGLSIMKKLIIIK